MAAREAGQQVGVEPAPAAAAGRLAQQVRQQRDHHRRQRQRHVHLRSFFVSITSFISSLAHDILVDPSRSQWTPLPERYD